jgi:GWxTD domain-containing protein
MKRVSFIFLTLLFLISLSFWFSSCALSKLEKNLKPDDAEFLSTVRYIITSEERKIFLELPESERERFKEEFWERRDPDPDTEENEFKIEYYKRIEQANQMFLGEGRPGWITDRGRIYILFGRPTERHTFPIEAAGYCREVWYYGNFPVIFIDEHCSGSYILSAINLEHLQDLNIAQGYFQRTITQERSFFDYDLKLRRSERTTDSLTATLSFSIKYEQIWFEVQDNASLETELYLTMEIKDKSGKVIWEGEETIPISFKDEGELKTMRERKFTLDISIHLPDSNYPLPPPGIYLLYSNLKQRTEGRELKKLLEIKL